MTDTAAKWSPAVVEELLFRQFIKNEDITAYLPAAPKVANDNYLDQYEQATKMLFAYVRNGPVATLATSQQHGGSTPVVKPYQTPFKSFLARTPTPTAKTRSETRPNAAPPLVPPTTSSSSSSLSSAPTLPISNSNTNPLGNSILSNSAAALSYQSHHNNQHQQQHQQHHYQQEEQVNNVVNKNNNNSSAATTNTTSSSLSALAPTAVPSISNNDKMKDLYSTATSAKANNTGNVNNHPAIVASGLSNVPCVNTLLGAANNSTSAANAMAKNMNARTLTPRPLSRAPSTHKNVDLTTPTSAQSQSHNEPQVKRFRIDWPAEVPSNNALKSNSRTKVAHLTAQRVAAQESVDPDLIFAQNKGELPLKVIFAQFPKALQNIAEIRNASGDWRTDTFSLDEEEEYKRDMKFVFLGASQCTYGMPTLMTQ